MYRNWYWILVGLWLLGSLGGKSLRYGKPETPVNDLAEAEVIRFLAERGWTQSGVKPITADGSYVALRFQRAGCATALLVTVLSPSREAEAATREVLGSDLAFLQAGALRDTVGMAAYHWQTLVAAAFARQPLPVLAISPAPQPSNPTQCAPPQTAAWSSLILPR